MTPEKTFRTVCPRNCYSTCGMLVSVRDGRITRIEGDPKNPATQGHVCLKGLAYARRVVAPDRILRPQRRKAAGGGFEPVSWDEALDDISARLQAIRQHRGPESVLYYEGSGSHGAFEALAMAFWHPFGGCTLTYGDLCWPAGLEATRLTYGANRHNHPRLSLESRFFLIWGHNPAETNVHQMRLIQEARDRGARVAVVDPRATDTSDIADLHLRPRPGSDAALALGMGRLIVEKRLHDREFLERHAVGVEEYLARLAEFPLERVSSVTGVPAEQIEELALAYAGTRPGSGSSATTVRARPCGRPRCFRPSPGTSGLRGAAGSTPTSAATVWSRPRSPPSPPLSGAPSRSPAWGAGCWSWTTPSCRLSGSSGATP